MSPGGGGYYSGEAGTPFGPPYIVRHKAPFMNVQRLSLGLYNHFNGAHKRRRALWQERILCRRRAVQKCTTTDLNRAGRIKGRAL